MDSSPEALFVEVGAAFVPYANDITPMFGAGVRFAQVHEVWARGGFIPTGDDKSLGFGVAGYRMVLWPSRVLRPFVGGTFVGLPETCSHNATGAQTCTDHPLFIVAAAGGLRVEATPWFSVAVSLSLGVDSYPNPFGMVELVLQFVVAQ